MFQPKYKDFCIVGLLGKNQVEVKDNHGHITKVHRKDMKKIPMTEKICQLYEEEQVGKVRNGRKAVPDSKMPDLGWVMAEELEIHENEVKTTTEKKNPQEIGETDTHTVHIMPEAVTNIIVLILTFLLSFKPYIQKFTGSAKKIVQAAMDATKTTSHKELSNIIDKVNRKVSQTKAKCISNDKCD